MDADSIKSPLHSVLVRARARWLNAAMINAGGRWAILPAGAAALGGLALALAGYQGFAAYVLLALLALGAMAVALLAIRQLHSMPRRPGAPDWALDLDRALDLDDALVTLLDGAGPFAPALEARVHARLGESRARAFAPKRRWGPLAVALLLALLPLGFWTPSANPDVEDRQARGADEPSKSIRSKDADSGGGDATTSSPKGKTSEKQGNGGPASDGDDGETRGTQPAPSARASDEPGDPPPADVRPEPAPSGAQERKVGDNKGPKPPEQTPPEKQPDSVERAITPEVGEGERRTRETSRYVYDPDGDRRRDTEARGPNWKERAEDAIPRMKLTSRERKLLEEWFNKIGR